MCKTYGCKKRAYYGYKYKDFIACREHKKDDMIYAKKILCICNKQPTFGYINDILPTCCTKCKKK